VCACVRACLQVAEEVSVDGFEREGGQVEVGLKPMRKKCFKSVVREKEKKNHARERKR
jgi:hypothetical protein